MGSSAEFYKDWWAEQEHGIRVAESEATFARRVRAGLRASGPAAKRVLDFGCGTGAASRCFADEGHQVTGVDVSATGITLAADQVPSARFHQIESEAHLPFADASFDVCFCTEAIEHLLDVTGFIREIHRVLDSGGLFILTTPYHGWLKNLLVCSLNFDRHFDPEGGHIRFFSRASLTRCLQGGGFEITEFQGIGRVWPFWKSMFVVARRQAH